MKLSTLGIGIACLLVAIGIGTRYFFTGSPDTSVVVAGESDSKYLIRGQAPLPQPAKLSHSATQKANPLRSSVQTAAVGSLSGSQVAQASLQNGTVPRNENVSGKRMSGFDSAPEPLGTPQDNFLESAGFPGEPTAAFAPLEPKPLQSAPASAAPQAGFALPQPQALETEPVAKPLGQADPFLVDATSETVPMASGVPAEPFPQATFDMPPDVPFSVSAGSAPVVRQGSAVLEEGTGTPGPAVLEGVQTPHLTIEKVLPAEIVINRPATIKTVIRNVGRSAAKDILILDHVPQGTQLLSTSPEANTSKNGELRWALGHLEASEQLIVEMRVVPLREGEIGSVASVNYTAEASARIDVTRPMLKVDVKVPEEIHLGQVANVEITISNPGTATATGVVLEEYVPDGLHHKDGKVLVNKNVDTLKPKEAKKLTLPLTCTGPGTLVNRLIVKADGDLKVEEKTTIRALSPVLNLEITGAKQRFLERKSGYRLIVSNSGTASAKNVDLVLTLPSAVQFVSTNQSGVYEPSTHTVHWALEELPSQEAGEIELIVLPNKIGEQAFRFTGSGQNNLKAETTHPISVDGLAAISFEVVGSSHLVEVGKETVYEIRVKNKGTKSSNNVRVRANLSEGMSFVRAEGPVRYQSQGGGVQFESLSRLDAKGEKVYKVAAKCTDDGDHRISVQVLTDDLRTPITKEESIRVFK